MLLEIVLINACDYSNSGTTKRIFLLSHIFFYLKLFILFLTNKMFLMTMHFSNIKKSRYLPTIVYLILTIPSCLNYINSLGIEI